jgi:hypothetical protein
LRYPVEAPREEHGNGEPVWAIQTPAKEAHREVEPEGSGETKEGAERQPTRERKVPGEWFASDAQRGSTRPTLKAKNGLEKGPVVDCVGLVNPKGGSTRPTLEAEEGLEKGPGVDRVSAVNPKSEPTAFTVGGEKDPGRVERVEVAPDSQTYEEALAGANAEL